jgi:D-3-phosphoglycerate dehydrogenase
LKVVGRAGVGVDNIDLQAAQAHGVIVVNTPVATTQAVAELVIGLIFSLARAIPRADSTTKQGGWLKKELIGSEIGGKTLGVLGMGQIGAAVAEKAAALGMAVLGYDLFLSDDQIARRHARPVGLDELYASSDYITIHTPLTEQTRALIDANAIRRLKPGVRLVCTARGGIIAEGALLEALESGQVAGAALDVYENEPPGSTPLVSHPNLIATPHIGAQTIEAQRRAAAEIAEEIIAALDGKPLRWRVV